MSEPMSSPDPGPDALAEAARWFVLLASGEATDADRARWHAWRAADARNEAGWRRAEAATALFGRIPEQHAPTAAGALVRRPVLNRGRRRALGGVAAAFIAGLTGWQGWRRSDASADQRTAVGELRDVILADGSLLQMDTDTVLDLDFSAHARQVRLRRGRVLITTAHQAHPAPPFIVTTAEGRVQALGTRFSVRQLERSTEAGVLEARVAVRPVGAPAKTVILSAGEFARFDRDGAFERRTLQTSDSAWTQGMLIADAMRLDSFAAELARYRSTPLMVAPDVAGLRISGTYPLADTQRALAAVCATLPVRLGPLRVADPSAGQVLLPAK